MPSTVKVRLRAFSAGSDMANAFDQFDQPQGSNPFDQFDPAASGQPPVKSSMDVTVTPAAPNWSEVPGQALKNAPASLLQLGENVVHPFIHPIETAQTFYDLGRGLVSKAAGVMGATQDPTEKAATEAKANAVGKFFADRYGSLDALKQTLATDPAGVLADAATILTGGELAAARAPGIIGEAARAAGVVGRAVDPITNAGRAASLAGRAAGRTAAVALAPTSGLTPGNIIQAGKAGLEGNQAFKGQMRATADADEPVRMAQAAVAKMRQERSAAYQADMSRFKTDKTILDYGPVNKSIDDAQRVAEYHGIGSDDATTTWQAIKNKVDAAQSMPPIAGVVKWPHYTPEGFDNLKQVIGDIRQSTLPGTKARVVADRVYNAIKDEITKQAPTYAKTMADYAAASDQLQQITKTFSLGDKVARDTSLRKLQSLMRHNANTNYASRAKLGQKLAEYQPDLPYAVAGQLMHTALPHGLRKALLSGTLSAEGLGAVALNPMLAAAIIPTMIGSSPRAIGEIAYAGGRTLRGLQNVAPSTARTAYQIGRTGGLGDAMYYSGN